LAKLCSAHCLETLRPLPLRVKVACAQVKCKWVNTVISLWARIRPRKRQWRESSRTSPNMALTKRFWMVHLLLLLSLYPTIII